MRLPMKGMLLAAWRFRNFIFSSIRNDFRARIARSKLGGAWMILHPLAQVLMYALVLSAVLSAKLPGIDNRFAYAIYLCAGILAWSLFSEIVSRCLTLFIDNGNLMKKVAFPKISLPLIVTGSVLVNNALLLVSIVFIFALLGHYPGADVLWLPLLFVITIMLALGMGLVLGVLNVFMRDIGQVVPVVLQFAFWFTPIVYSSGMIPENYRGWLAFNPMYHVATAYQNVLVYNRAPEWKGLLMVAVLGMVLLGFSLLLFRRASAEMVDAL
ncbi:MAG: ABC transporter permease [Gallionella sp.]|nr:ABC transporter permease [Gallionella sp.]